jgi:hypothetical protein
MKALSITFGATLACISNYADAKPMTLACQYKYMSHAGIDDDLQLSRSPYKRVDQIFIDPDTSTVEFRVSNTVGTEKEEIYSWSGTDDRACRKPQIQINSYNSDISGTQQCGASNGFYYTPHFHQFIATILYSGVGATFVWDCHP